MSIDPKFVEVTADVLEISLLYNTLRMVVTFWIFEKYLG